MCDRLQREREVLYKYTANFEASKVVKIYSYYLHADKNNVHNNKGDIDTTLTLLQKIINRRHAIR